VNYTHRVAAEVPYIRPGAGTAVTDDPAADWGRMGAGFGCARRSEIRHGWQTRVGIGTSQQRSPLPQWEHFGPGPAQRVRSRAGSTRYAREEQEARAAFDGACRRYAAAEMRRREQLAKRRDAYRATSAEAIKQALEYNEGINQFARDLCAGDSESVARFCTLVLDRSCRGSR